MLNCIPINRAFYIDHFSVYIVGVFIRNKKGKKFLNLVKIQNKLFQDPY